MRMHGTIQARPAEVFPIEEQPRLRPTPATPYDVPTYTTPQVQRDHHIEASSSSAARASSASLELREPVPSVTQEAEVAVTWVEPQWPEEAVMCSSAGQRPGPKPPLQPRVALAGVAQKEADGRPERRLFRALDSASPLTSPLGCGSKVLSERRRHCHEWRSLWATVRPPAFVARAPLRRSGREQASTRAVREGEPVDEAQVELPTTSDRSLRRIAGVV